MSIGNGAPAWPSVIVSNGRISRSEHKHGDPALPQRQHASGASGYRHFGRIKSAQEPDQKMLLANLYAASGSVMRVAKGDRRVCATGMSASHAAVRTKLSAVAIKRWSKRVFARSM